MRLCQIRQFCFLFCCVLAQMFFNLTGAAVFRSSSICHRSLQNTASCSSPWTTASMPIPTLPTSMLGNQPRRQQSTTCKVLSLPCVLSPSPHKNIYIPFGAVERDSVRVFLGLGVSHVALVIKKFKTFFYLWKTFKFLLLRHKIHSNFRHNFECE